MRVYTRATTDERFWRYVEKTVTCWLWRGGLNSGGYGIFHVREGDRFRSVMAHRYAFGATDPKQPLDHLCRVRHCVNPDHLEVVTPRENIRRGETGFWNKMKTHCKRGHEFTPQNTIIKKTGWRNCKACDALAHREKRRLARS